MEFFTKTRIGSKKIFKSERSKQKIKKLGWYIFEHHFLVTNDLKDRVPMVVIEFFVRRRLLYRTTKPFQSAVLRALHRILKIHGAALLAFSRDHPSWENNILEMKCFSLETALGRDVRKKGKRIKGLKFIKLINVSKT